MIVSTGFFKLGLITLVYIFSISSGLAQEKLKKELDKIKGDVDKITITADGEEFIFEGKDAQKIFQRMKSGTKHMKTYMITTDDDSIDKHKITINSDDCDGKVFKMKIKDSDGDIWIGEDGDVHGLHEKIKVEVNDGNKKVTVTTKEDGEEKTEVYEGEQADKVLQELKSEHGHDWMIGIDKYCGDKKMKKMIIEMEEESSEIK